MGWGTERLTELIVALGGVADPAAAAQRGVERTAEALETETVALVCDGEVLASFGWPRIEVPERELLALARSGAAAGELAVPGAGLCPAAVVALDDGHGTALIAARAGAPLDSTELTLLRGLGRALAQSLALLGAVEAERGLRVRSEQQARDNARLLQLVRERQRLLEALATIQRSISHRAPLQDILRAIVGTAGELLHDPGAELVWGAAGDTVAGRAMAENRLVVIEREQTTIAAPVHEQGEVIGALVVAADRTYSRAEQGILLTLAEHASLALTDAKTVGAMVHQALHDTLTGLPNRALFLDRLAHALARRGNGGGGEVGVLFCDLDRFKTINDSLGHQAGDELLVAVARRIQQCLRGSDTAARLGGDEFVVLLEDVRSTDEAIAIAARITEAFRTPFAVFGREVYVSASIGIVRGRADADELLRNADVAMYRAKAEGSGRSAVFEPSMRAEVLERLELEGDLRRAQERGELEVHFQPIVALADGELVGFEALARWRHPERGLVPPPAFIPVAEESDLIHELGRFVLDEACRHGARWGASTITVNLSGRQLERADLVDQVRAALVASGLEAPRLVLEITETVLMHDTEATIARLAALKALGVRLAVDDFGTGYSSLRYLSRFPVDLLKMAKPFVDGVGSEQGAALARTIVDLGASLGLAIVAEGIEQGVQLARLRRLGCQLGQGYLFGRPLPSGDVDALLARSEVAPYSQPFSSAVSGESASLPA